MSLVSCMAYENESFELKNNLVWSLIHSNKPTLYKKQKIDWYITNIDRVLQKKDVYTYTMIQLHV